jgi:hypothetical protein
MYFLPQPREFLKVQGRSVQNFLHVPPLGIGGADGIVPFRYCDGPVQPKINDRFCLTGEAVNMTRPMIVRIGDK